MIFLLIATIFQSLVQKSTIKRLNRKKKTLLHWEPWTLLKSTKPINVTSCVWLFYKVNTLKSFYLRSDPSSSTDLADERQRALRQSDRPTAASAGWGKGHRGKGGRPARPWPCPGPVSASWGLLCLATHAGRAAPMAAHGDERSAVLGRTSMRSMVEKGEGSDRVERATRHGAVEGPGGGSKKLCRKPAMAASARSLERGRESGPRERGQ